MNSLLVHYRTRTNIYESEKENGKLTASQEQLTLSRMASHYEHIMRRSTI
jgi:hypothetical protein